MPENNTSLKTRIVRLFQLLRWLIQLVRSCRKYPQMSVQEQEKTTRHLARNVLDILHVHTHIQGEIPNKMTHTLIVANHVSWLDMVAIMAFYPVHFVAKTEIQKWPILGKVISALGTIFIDRSRRKDSEYINQTIAEGLQAGKNIMFFPEAGTSDDGFTMKPFKAALFASAITASVPVQGIAIRYYEAEKRTCRSAYSKGMSLWRCVWNIVSLPEHTVQLDFLPLLSAQEMVNMNRHEIKDKLEKPIQTLVYEDYRLPE